MLPTILVQILITLALKFGLPWILTKFPGIPASVVDIIKKLIEDLAAHKEVKQNLVTQAKAQAIAEVKK